MPVHSRDVVEEFCNLCEWVLHSWQTRKYLFDENPDVENLKIPRYAHFFVRLSYILQEYWIQQLAKLHDPAIQQGHKNLSIDYIIDYGEWDATTRAELVELRDRMMTFERKIREARNKVIAHNDLSTILRAQDLGEFDSGDDAEYFRNLRKFACIVRKVALGDRFLPDELVKNDVRGFMDCFNRGIPPRDKSGLGNHE